ncbi:MAG: branched-chain amino acid ABC transporter permease [Archaeoglobus sp.]|uniref:branched-chain amino acid ABC transporter permease n=1 Tax=Archaeoglobus sp. TaxID=1872626 RepID=UPI001D4B536B|nr:branched-chain amino acid ABC transporter permease [Archaeoglobus sp.]MBO8179171.1 branched-chain amino acid ABC transporter permease [Archaeoglobus sp.]
MAFVEQLISNLLYGAILGSVYGLATMGLSLIFGVLRIVNVGHGAFIMVGAFIAYWMFILYGIPPLISLFLAIAVGMAIGLAIYMLVVKRLVDAPELASLLAMFAIGIFIEEFAKQIWGADYVGYSWEIGGVSMLFTEVPFTKLLAFASSIVIAAVVYVWFRKTKIGKAVRAVVEDREGATTCGIDVNRIYALSFSLGIGLTVLSGVLVTLFTPVGINVYMGGEYTLKAFVIAVLGGLASPWGAFYAGFIFGLIENGSYTLLGLIPGVEPFGLTRFLSSVVLMLVLLVKPTGLLGGE